MAPGFMMVRMIQARWRLFLSGLAFLVLTIATLLRYGWHWTPGFLIAWDIGVVLYLSLVFWLAAQADTTFIRRRSELQDVGRASPSLVRRWSGHSQV